jgi:hypothetical protein
MFKKPSSPVRGSGFFLTRNREKDRNLKISDRKRGEEKKNPCSLNNLSQADSPEQQKHGNLNQKREISFPSTQEEKQKKPSIRQLRIRPDNQNR